MTRWPGASLANPNKAARRVTAVEFACDSDDTWLVFYFRPVTVLVYGGCRFLDGLCVWMSRPAAVGVILTFLLTCLFLSVLHTPFEAETNRAGCLTVNAMCVVINEGAC
jgi:hypothetical protein